MVFCPSSLHRSPNLAFASLFRMSLRILLLLVVLHAAAGFAFLKDTGEGFPLDDTWLHMVYARSFGEGRGFAYNEGQPETGVTAPLWTALLEVPVGLSEFVADQQAALAAEGGVLAPREGRPDPGVRLLGGLMGLFMAFVGWRLASRAGTWPAVFVGLVLSFDPLLTFDRFAGMELPLFGLLTLMLVGALQDGRESRAAILSGLLVFTRPEGVLLIALGAVWFMRRRQGWARYLGISTLFLLSWRGHLLARRRSPDARHVVLHHGQRAVPGCHADPPARGVGDHRPDPLLLGALRPHRVAARARARGHRRVGHRPHRMGRPALSPPLRRRPATHDAGAVRFFGRRKVLDIYGNQNHEFLTREREGIDSLRQWLTEQDPDVLVVFPALWARNHSPELSDIWKDLPPQQGAALLASSDDFADFFGLTKRAATFHTDETATVPSPLHADMAIFVRP